MRLIRSDATERCHSPISHRPVTPQLASDVELLVRDGVERAQVPPVAARQLVEPDVRALGHEHHARHPGRIAGEGLRLIGDDGSGEGRHIRRQVLATTATTEAQVEAALLLSKDADRDVQPADERVEIGAEDRAPVLPDEAQLAGERGRAPAGPAPAAARRATPSFRPGAPAPHPPAKRCLQAGGHVVVACALAEDPVVDELAQRPEGRVLVGDPDEQQLLEAVDGRFGLRPDAREGRGEAVEHEVGVLDPELAADVAERARHRARVRAPRTARSAGGRPRGAARAPRSRRPRPTARPPAGPSSFARRGDGSRRGRRRRGRHGRRAARHRSRSARAPSGEHGTRALGRRMARACACVRTRAPGQALGPVLVRPRAPRSVVPRRRARSRGGAAPARTGRIRTSTSGPVPAGSGRGRGRRPAPRAT